MPGELEQINQRLRKANDGRGSVAATANGLPPFEGRLVSPIVYKKRMNWKSDKLQQPIEQRPQFGVGTPAARLDLEQPY